MPHPDNKRLHQQLEIGEQYLRKYYTVNEVAQLYDVVPNTIYAWIKRGLIKALKLNPYAKNGDIRITRKELIRLDSQTLMGEIGNEA
jgi:transposase-like protein